MRKFFDMSTTCKPKTFSVARSTTKPLRNYSTPSIQTGNQTLSLPLPPNNIIRYDNNQICLLLPCCNHSKSIAVTGAAVLNQKAMPSVRQIRPFLKSLPRRNTIDTADGRARSVILLWNGKRGDDGVKTRSRSWSSAEKGGHKRATQSTQRPIRNDKAVCIILSI